jgi:hypothetical protein
MRARAERADDAHVPYRDSVLTRLLEARGGSTGER